MEHACLGLSMSMAVQGTNAHAILGSGTDMSTAALRPQAGWRQKRFWHAVVPHELLQRLTLADKEVVRLEAALGSLALAHLSDHQVGAGYLILCRNSGGCLMLKMHVWRVRHPSPHRSETPYLQVHGVPVLPQAVLVEMACQAAKSLRDDGIAARLLLAQVCMESFHRLPASSDAVISCEGNLKTSTVRVMLGSTVVCTGTAAQVMRLMLQCNAPCT